MTLLLAPFAGAAATGAPATPTLTQSSWDGSSSYSIIMNMWWGNNGTTCQLLENGVLVRTATLADNSPNAQTTSFAFTGKANGSYVYTSKLINSFGTTTGGALTYTVTQGGSAVTIPAIPTGLAATAASTSQINVAWDASSGATGYDLQIDGTVVANVTSPRAHTGLTAGSNHNYAVRAKNTAGASAFSALVFATTPTTITPPAVPTGLSATPNSTSQITVNWNTVASATGYDLQVDGSTVTSAARPYVHTGLATNSLHNYAVRAKNTAGTSAFSSSVSARTRTTDTGTLTLGQVANPNGRYFSGYYPSWSDNWFTILNNDGTKKSDNDIYTASNLAKTAGVYTHLLISFGQPNFSWSGLAANNWSGTGINFTAMPADIKEVIRLLHILKKRVILAVGGATYNNWAGLAAEAGVANGPTKAALTQFMIDMGIDGLDVDYEVDGADPANVTQYARAIQAMREAVDAAGGGRLLTLAPWSTGADYTAAHTGDPGYPGTPSYWGGSAGRERQLFKITVSNGPLAGRRIVSLFDLVNLISYDAQTFHYDPVTAFDQYRALVPSNIPVSLGLEVAPEGWAGGLLVVNNSQAGAVGTIVVADQYGRTPRGPYSVERFGNHVLNNTLTANPHDGLMLWHVLKTTSVPAGSSQTANASTIVTKVSSMFGYVPTSP